MIPGKTDKATRLLYKLYKADTLTVMTIVVTSLWTSRTSVSDNDLVTISQLKAIL
jgi:hypothetical protein